MNNPDKIVLITGATAQQGGATARHLLSRGRSVRRLVRNPSSPAAQAAYSVSLDGTVIEWQIADPSLDELRDWIHANRYVRGLTCAERAQYRVEPLCDSASVAPSAAP
jgi:uncharacterized protein YbjT (DUF2867 family)